MLAYGLVTGGGYPGRSDMGPFGAKGSCARTGADRMLGKVNLRKALRDLNKVGRRSANEGGASFGWGTCAESLYMVIYQRDKIVFSVKRGQR